MESTRRKPIWRRSIIPDNTMTGKIRVLLVEDEQTQTMIIKDTLDGQGLNVSLSYDGNEDLSRFYTECPNVQVVDVMMPRMDGFEMVPRIRMM